MDVDTFLLHPQVRVDLLSQYFQAARLLPFEPLGNVSVQAYLVHLPLGRFFGALVAQRYYILDLFLLRLRYAPTRTEMPSVLQKKKAQSSTFLKIVLAQSGVAITLYIYKIGTVYLYKVGIKPASEFRQLQDFWLSYITKY